MFELYKRTFQNWGNKKVGKSSSTAKAQKNWKWFSDVKMLRSNNNVIQTIEGLG